MLAVESSVIRGRGLAWLLGGGYAQACTLDGISVGDCSFGSTDEFWGWCLGLKPKGKGFIGLVAPAWDGGPAGWIQAIETLVGQGLPGGSSGLHYGWWDPLGCDSLAERI